ncbi:hypothetical protein B296_00022061 [Ensete ventricosum]|uniref:Uncharacterized protein n=1 Tax=Ensete ventricosum TaxID=4639 RepID=A0A426XVZ2_ENSVE|nr:hypothetical protein B296_00022061 [Ensete ventricosum]
MTLTLTGFTRDAITPISIVTLPVTFSDEPRIKTLMVPFMVVKLPSAYNVIIDRPTLNKLRAVISTYHRSIKFLTNARAGEVRSDPRESRQCYIAATIIPKKVKKEALVPDPREPDEPDSRPEPTEPILSLVFAIEVVLPPKVVYLTLRIEHFTPGASKVGLMKNLDFIEDHKAKAHLRILHYHRVVTRLLKARFKPLGSFVRGHRLRPLYLQLLLMERDHLGQREHVLLETGSVVLNPLQAGVQGVNLLHEVLAPVL